MKKNQLGDTIIEVMVAISIMGLALGAAYVLSNRSFHTAQHTHERIEAMALAQGQVEFLKNKGLSDDIGTLPPAGTDFCFRDDNGNVLTPAATNDYCRSYGSGNASLYNISISYSGSGGSPANVFTVTATWDAAGGGQNNLTLYYKPPS